MALIWGFTFSLLLSKFHYIMPLNPIIPVIALLSCKSNSFRYILALMMGIVVDSINPFRIWLSPIFLLITAFAFDYVKDSTREIMIILILIYSVIYLMYDFISFNDALVLTVSRSFLTVMTTFIIFRRCEDW